MAVDSVTRTSVPGLYPLSADYQLTVKLLLPEWAEADGIAVDSVTGTPVPGRSADCQLIMSSSNLSELKLMGWPLILLPDPLYLVFIHDQLIVSWLISSSYLSELKLMGWPLMPLQGPPFLVSMFSRTRLNSRKLLSKYFVNTLYLIIGLFFLQKNMKLFKFKLKASIYIHIFCNCECNKKIYVKRWDRTPYVHFC